MNRALRTTLAAAGAGGLALAGAVAWAAARSRPERPGAPAPLPPAELPELRAVTLPGRGEVVYRTAGDGMPIVLLHGWMFSADLNWFPAYRPLAELGRILAPDHRGHGRGLRPAAPFRLADAADDIAALLRALETGPAVVVGYSMGGPVAQLLWRRHPELVRGIVLCATSDTFNDTRWERVQWRAVGALQLGLRLLPRHAWERLAELQAAGQIRLPVTRLVTTETPREVVELFPWIIGELSRGSAEDIGEAGRELSRYDARGWLGELDVPAAVVVTTEDQLVPVQRQREMAARIHACEVFEVPLDHDGAVSGAETFVPALRKAVEWVVGRA